ncbi:phospholipase D family protein [Candidatus Mesenet endosymbiont of Agriotes lineatus]|uniref:phospholipase D family nuclease n=1 Tax=Candidatus Mesenet endosymbiont of Agriotes lineatus TaxID=3077948 RepID=UPI0030CBF1E1
MNVRYLLILLTCLSLSGCVNFLPSFCPKTSVCFTPGNQCTKRIIDAVNQSKKSILVQAYIFSSKPIAQSLITAKNRGIDVKVILDKTQIHSKYSVINELFQYKIQIWIDLKPSISHNKIIIIDNQKIITGSFNFTASAELRNAENLLIITGNHALTEKYVENWKERQLQSNPYTPAGKE